MTTVIAYAGDALPDERQDVIVIGAGVAGLSAAALLAREGLKVTLLEAIHYPGGCASSYEKEDAVFDVGATTFSGTSDFQPLATLFERIGSFDALLPASPPMGIVMNGEMLLRHSDRHAWAEEAERFFRVPLRRFWDNVSSWSDASYRMLRRLEYLPPRTPREFFRDLRALDLEVLRAAPGLLRSVAAHLRSHGITDSRFRCFIDAQLLITSQGGADDIPFLAGALGLAYPDYPVYSVRGGMINYARFLERRTRKFGGRVCYRQSVTAIRQVAGGWEVETRRGSRLHARQVVTNLPLFNLPSISEGPVQNHFTRSVARLRRKRIPLWGALTMYALVEDSLPSGMPINLQVLLDRPLRSSGSDTLFLSFSHPDDHERAPADTRTLTISTHIPLHRFPPRSDRERYLQWKREAEAEMRLALGRALPDLAALRVLYQRGGTPATFLRYTGRADGNVGGIPLHRRVFPFSYPRSTTPFDGLYCIGDTFFPGQGIPGVTLGALSVSKRILENV